MLHLGVRSLATGGLSLLLAIVPAAIYASLINDVTDLAGDGKAGKQNRLAALGRLNIATLVALTVGAGFFFAWTWRDNGRLLWCYLATWLSFTFYSIPPFRLKERGTAGVLCDAAGELLFPALAAVFLAARAAHEAVGTVWMASVALWALAYGLRGIVWHQLTDVDNDRVAGFSTCARRHPRGAPIIGTFIVFPIELGSLAAMLWQIGSAWPPLFLMLYALYAVRSARRSGRSPVIVVPKQRFFIVLHQFYSDLFPVGLLVTASLRDPRVLIVLAAHVLLFPRRVVHAIRRLSASTARTVVNASEPHHGGVG